MCLLGIKKADKNIFTGRYIFTRVTLQKIAVSFLAATSL